MPKSREMEVKRRSRSNRIRKDELELLLGGQRHAISRG
jgi:hypothetical protein